MQRVLPRLKAGNNVALAIHMQYGNRCATQLTGLAARHRKDIACTKAHTLAVESNYYAIAGFENVSPPPAI